MSSAGGEQVRTIRLADLPVAPLLALRNHADDLLHELRVIGAGMATGNLDAEVPLRLAALIEELNERYASPRLISRRLVDEAAARGDETVTLEIDVPASAAGALEHYVELLDEAEEFCQKGELLTLALPADLLEFRHRLVEELTRQLQ